MNKFYTLVGVAVAVVCMAAAAPAADWLRSGTLGKVTQTVSPGSFVTNHPLSDTDDSLLLYTGACNSLDLLYYNDVDGDETIGTVTVQVKTCPVFVSLDIDATVDVHKCWPIENVTLDGIASTGTEAIYGASAAWIFAEAGGVNDVDTQLVQLVVRCIGQGR